MERIKFASIDSIAKVYENIKNSTQFVGNIDNQPVFDRSISLPKIPYVGTVKLHGTCAGITLYEDGKYVTISKERIITPESDNDGFSKWVFSKNKTVLNNLFEPIVQTLKEKKQLEYPITVFGEWCGKGIQNKAAITQCERALVIFAIRVGNHTDNGGKAMGWKPLTWFKGVSNHNERIFSTQDFEKYHAVLDWNKPLEVEQLVEKLTSDINDSCPVAKFFGVEGVGEGIVWMPELDHELNNVRLWFKTKGNKHKQNKKKKDTAVEPQKVTTIQEIIDEYFVENRLERALYHFNEAGIEKTIENTGIFVSFMANDILKDADIDFKQCDVTEKDIRKSVSKEAGKWYVMYLHDNRFN